MTFDELLDTYPPRIATAFREAVESIKSSVVLKTIVARLERGDIAGAVAAVQFEPEAFASLELSLREAFNAGGMGMVQSLPSLVSPDGMRVLFQFGVRNLEAERLIREQSTTLVTNITEDQRQALRTVFETGLTKGQNPTVTALDAVGRVNRVTGRREGGSIGLTARQVDFIYGENGARAKLLSGDPDLLKQYLGLKTRDNAIRQQIDGGKIAAQDVTKKWKHSGSEHPRLQHIELASQSREAGVPIDMPFIAPDGTMLMYPHDPRAPAKHRIGCRCRMEYDIDYIAAGLRRYRARAA
jgi:hypothetical protein